MKKLLSIILALVMILSMAACSNEPTEPEEPVSSEAEVPEEPTEPEVPEFSGAEVKVGILLPLKTFVLIYEDSTSLFLHIPAPKDEKVRGPG